MKQFSFKAIIAFLKELPGAGSYAIRK